MVVQAPANEARNLGRLEGDAVAVFAGTLRHNGRSRRPQPRLEGRAGGAQVHGRCVRGGQGAGAGDGHAQGRIDVLGQRVAVMEPGGGGCLGGAGRGRDPHRRRLPGQNPDVPNAARTYLGPQAVRAAPPSKAMAGASSSGPTSRPGSLSARGGPAGGNDGGFAECRASSGWCSSRAVDLRAPAWVRSAPPLLDPDFINVAVGGTADHQHWSTSSPDNPGQSLIIAPTTLNAVGGNVVLQAVEDIGFDSPVNLTTAGASLTAQAGASSR